MDNNKEKYLSESLLSEEPKKKFVLKLKSNSVTGDKIAPNAVDWDKLSQRIKDLFASIQAAIGEPIDPDTIKEMIRNVIKEMIDSGDEIIDEDALADRITQAVLNSLGEKYPSFKLDDSEISDSDLINQPAHSGTVGEVVFSTTLHTFLFKDTDQLSLSYGKYYKAWEGSDDYLINNNAGPKKGVIFMVEDGSDYYYWDGHNLVPLGSKEVIDIDAIAERVAEIIQVEVEDKDFIPFDGVMSKTTSVTVLDATAPQDVEGNILFYAKTGTFIYEVYEEQESTSGQVSPPILKYYKYWKGWTDYKDAQDTPKSKVVFVLRDGSSYYYWDGSELQEFVTEESLAATISALVIEATPIKGNNGVKVVDTTEVIGNKTVKVKTASLADISKETYNMIGTTYVFGNTLPTVLSSNTKYVIANNVSNNAGKITLPSGSKIVPNGGMPTVAVEGGEMSWVHSSDVGFIQDNGTHDTDIGAYNYSLFKSFVKTRYNLILDGEYYMHTSSRSTIEGKASDSAITLDRPLCIKDGTLNLLNEFINIVDGGSLKAENTTFVKLEDSASYPIICIAPTESLIDRIEFINCNFIGKARGYLGSLRFVCSYIPSTIAPADVQIKWTSKYFEEASLNKPYIIDEVQENDTVVYYYYIFPDDYIVDTVNKTVKYINEGKEVIVDYKDWKNHASIFAQQFSNVYFENNDAGDTIFVPDDQSTKWAVDGIPGYYKLYSLASADEIQKSNGKRYSTMPGADDDTVLVEHCGIRVLRFVDCRMDGAKIDCGNIEITDTCEFTNCTFSRITSDVISLGSINTYPYSNDWLKKSCPCIVTGCIFSGLKQIIPYSSITYMTPMLIENSKLVVRNCRMEDLICVKTTYEVYGNVEELIFENNYVYNVLNAVHKAPKNNHAVGTEFFKSKGAWYVDKSPVRIIRNNWYEIDRETLWPLFESYMKENYKTDPLEPEGVFNEYAMNTSMLNFITPYAVFSKIIIEGNTFKSDGSLIPYSTSNRTANVENFQLINNRFIFRNFNSDPTNPLILLRTPKPKNTSNIVITGNTFTAKESSVITLISTFNVNCYPDNVIISNNIFNNCSFRLNDYDGGNCREAFKVGNITIKNNILNSLNGLPSTISHKSNIALSGGLYLAGDYQRYKVLGKANIDYIDFQDGGTVAPTAKIIDAVESEGIINVKIPHMCRTLALRSDGFSDGKLTGNNRTLVFKWSYFGNESYAIEIKYTYKDVKYTKYIEILHSFPVGPKNVYAAFTVRDVKGLIYRNTAVNNDGFTISNLSTLDDVGLQFFVEAIAQFRAITNYKTELGSIYFHIYTMYPDGSRNDAGTDIEIKTYKIPNSLLLPSFCNAAWNIGTPTSISKFVPSGSTVTQQWVDTISAGYSYTYKVSKDTQQTTTVPYLVAADAGYSVYIDDRKYTWNGASWDAEKRIVSLTQAEYDAIVTKDADTLYLITD